MNNKRMEKPNLSNYFKLPNPGLRSYFARVDAGQSDDYRTPFWNGKSRSAVVSSWMAILQSNTNRSAMNMVPGLLDQEISATEKVGPLSIMEPLSRRMDSIRQYYTSVEGTKAVIASEAVNALKNKVRVARGIRFKSAANTIADMRLDTNSGTPYFTKRRRVVDDTLKLVSQAPNLMSQGDQYYSAILGWRGQEGGPTAEDVKQRVVWMMPFALNVLELQVYQPCIAAWQQRNLNSAYINNRAVEMKITKFFDTKGDEYCVVTDFSKFDQHFNSVLQNVAKEILEYLIVPSSFTDYWFAQIFPFKYNIGLICDENTMMSVQPHGMASGSAGTNFDECLAHAALQEEVAYVNNATLNPYSNAYGDDGYLSFKGIDVDKVIRAYTSHGLEMNADKQYVSKHSAVYLRRYYHDSYRDKTGIMLGVYPTVRALGRLLGQERYFDEEQDSIEYKRLVELRAYSILENCKNHPLFYKFVDFVKAGDKYKLGLAIPGFVDSLGKEVHKLKQYAGDILGYTKTLQGDDFQGIDSWEVVKYLKSQRK